MSIEYPQDYGLDPNLINIIGIDDWLIIGADPEGMDWYVGTEMWPQHLDGSVSSDFNWTRVIEYAQRNKSNLEWQRFSDIPPLTRTDFIDVQHKMEQILSEERNARGE